MIRVPPLLKHAFFPIAEVPAPSASHEKISAEGMQCRNHFITVINAIIYVAAVVVVAVLVAVDRSSANELIVIEVQIEFMFLRKTLS